MFGLICYFLFADLCALDGTIGKAGSSVNNSPNQRARARTPKTQQQQSQPRRARDMTIGPLATPRVGRYRYTIGTGELTWSDTVYEIYGYKPGELELRLDAVVEHCHPDERQRAQEIVANTIETGDRCLYAHRIVTKNGTLRDVVILGDAEYDADGTFVDVAGYVLDVTEHTDRVVTNRLGQELDGIVDSRAVIEQAKGILMLAFGIDADKAFAVLAWQSQSRNVKLRQLASRIIADVTDNAALAAPIKDAVQDLLLSAHARLGQVQV